MTEADVSVSAQGTRAAWKRVNARDAGCCRTLYEAVNQELSYPKNTDLKEIKRENGEDFKSNGGWLERCWLFS